MAMLRRCLATQQADVIQIICNHLLLYLAIRNKLKISSSILRPTYVLFAISI